MRNVACGRGSGASMLDLGSSTLLYGSQLWVRGDSYVYMYIFLLSSREISIFIMISNSHNFRISYKKNHISFVSIF